MAKQGCEKLGLETFDALVEFDGSESSGYKEKTVTGTGTVKNDYLAPNISDMDSKTNAFLIMPRNWDEEAMQRMVAGQKSAAIEAMNTDVGNNGTDSDTYQPLDWKDVYKYTKRTLHIKIEESGDSDVLPGVSMDVLDFNEMNEALIAEGKQPAEGKQVMLGITKASLATDSFLSAASFQETTKVLTEAAINGKVDHLIGLKENVIIGKLIPAGTGMKRYRSVKLNTDAEPQDEIALEDDDEILLSGDEDMEDEAPEVFDIDDSEE